MIYAKHRQFKFIRISLPAIGVLASKAWTPRTEDNKPALKEVNALVGWEMGDEERDDTFQPSFAMIIHIPKNHGFQVSCD